MRARPIGVAALLAVVASLLTSCRTDVGVAATVDGHRISESTVAKYVTLEGAGSAAKAAAAGQALPEPKPLVLQTLVLEQLYTRTLAAQGAAPTPSQLAAAHDPGVQLQFQSSATGRALDRAVSQALQGIGISPSFTPDVVRYSELFYLIAERVHAQSADDVNAAVAKVGAHVRINPRYGSWDSSSQSIKSTGAAGLPGYLSLQPTPIGSAGAGIPAP